MDSMNAQSFFESVSDPDQWNVVTKNQLIQRAKSASARQEVKSDLVTSDSPTLFSGPLCVQGSMQVRNSFLVLGDLEVSGAIWSEKKSSWPDPSPPVVWIIAGNLRCRGLFPSHSDHLMVAGKVHSTDCVMAETCPRILSMGIQTRLFYGDVSDGRIKVIDKGKIRKVHAKQKIPLWHFDNPTYNSDALYEILLPELIDWREEKFWGSYAEPSISRIRDRICTGQAIFKGATT